MSSEGSQPPESLPSPCSQARDRCTNGFLPKQEPQNYWLGERGRAEGAAPPGRELPPLPQPSLPTAPSFPSSLPRALTARASRSAAAASGLEELEACQGQLLSSYREEIASAKVWLTDWALGVERSLSSHREALNKQCLSAAQTGDQGPRNDEHAACCEDRLVTQLTRLQQEHLARVEVLLGRHTSAVSGTSGQTPSPNPRARRTAPQPVPLEPCTPRSGRSSPRPGQLSPNNLIPRDGSNASVEWVPRCRSASKGSSAAAKYQLPQEEKWDDALKHAHNCQNETHAWALLSALGFRNSNTGLSIPKSPSSTSSGIGMHKWVLKGWLHPKQFSSRTDKYIQMFSISLVLANTIYMGVHASMSLDFIKKGRDPPDVFKDIDVAFAILFILELTVRLWVERMSFFNGTNARWNAFDTVLALTPVVDVLVSAFNFSFLRSLKAFRAVRAARMIKAITFVRDLRLMVASILCSLASLLWAFFLLAFVVYLFSIFLMQSIEVYAGDLGKSPDGPLIDMYGTLQSSMYTLFCAISGGRDWADVVLPFDRIWEGYRFIFVCYVIFVSFGVLNILTAIFVESAKRIAEIDREILIQDQISREKSTMNEIRRIFKGSDEDLDGRLSRHELEKVLKDQRTAKHLQVLELDINEVSGLFQLLDIDDQNTVVIDEFVIQLMRLKGGAKGLDLQTVLYENKRIFLRLTAMMRFVEKHLGIVETALQLHPGSGDGLTMVELIRNEEAMQKNAPGVY